MIEKAGSATVICEAITILVGLRSWNSGSVPVWIPKPHCSSAQAAASQEPHTDWTHVHSMVSLRDGD